MVPYVLPFLNAKSFYAEYPYPLARGITGAPGTIEECIAAHK